MACKQLGFVKGQIVAYNGMSLCNIVMKLNHYHSSINVFYKAFLFFFSHLLKV